MDEKRQQKILIGVFVSLIVILLVLLLVVFAQIKNARKLAQFDESATPTVSVTQTAKNLDVSYDLGSPTEKDNLDSVRDVSNRFMQAKEDRSLEAAKPYMTEDLYNKTTQDEFAGASFPSMDRFEIISAALSDQENSYEVIVKSYWLLQGEDAGEVDYKLEITKSDEDYLVNGFVENSSSQIN